MAVNHYIGSKYYPSFDLFCIQYTDNSAEIIQANTTNITFKTKVVDTFIRFNYTTTDSPLDFTMQVWFEYEELDGGTLSFL